MKRNIIASYIHGVFKSESGDSWGTILSYFFPEFITALVLYSLLYLIDAHWIADLKSTTMYATVTTTNTMLHFLTKMAEGFSVGTVILVGNFNGLQEYKQVGKTLSDAFWVTVLSGSILAVTIYCSAYWIYYLYGVPAKMIQYGVPFLRLRALSFLLIFMYLGIVGFLRGIKKPRVPMQIFIVGAIVFLFFDYSLIFGKFGFPALGIQGSALAAIVQYSVMLLLALGYIFFDKENRKYAIPVFLDIKDWSRVKEIVALSLPVMVDKATLAAAYLWLGYTINPMGKYAIASFDVLKDLERLAILPAAAFAQVITFLVSNAYGVHEWEGIKANVKKVVFLASFFVFLILLVFSLWPSYFISFFDGKGKFTAFSARIFPFLSVLVFFDLLQLILAGALRGAANVKTVMFTRLAVCTLYFIPVSWAISKLPIENMALKFFLIYSSFYVGNGLMSIIYIMRFRGQQWKKQLLS